MSAAEEWRPCPWFEGWYEVSDLGRVRRIRKSAGAVVSRILKAGSDGQGYLQVRLSANRRQATITVHKLVATAFIGPRPPGMQVNHKDGDKRNPALFNLEYLTQSGNMLHAYAAGLHRRTPGRSFHARRREKVLEYKRLHGALISHAQAVTP